MRTLLKRRTSSVARALTVTLFVVSFLAICIPVDAAQACACCAGEKVQALQIDDFTVAKVVTIPPPSVLAVLHHPALELSNPSDVLSRAASGRACRLTPPGVPIYLLATTLLI